MLTLAVILATSTLIVTVASGRQSDSNDDFLQFIAENDSQLSLHRWKRHHRFRWLVDNDYNPQAEEWYRYDCKRVSYLDQCSGVDGGTFKDFECFKPSEVNLRYLRLEDGFHKLLDCKTTSTEDYVVLAVNWNGIPISVGTATVSKVIRCNNHGKWVTKIGYKKEIAVEDAFCLIIPKR